MCYRRRNALTARDLVVDLMVADIARGMNTGAFPRTSTPSRGSPKTMTGQVQPEYGAERRNTVFSERLNVRIY